MRSCDLLAAICVPDFSWAMSCWMLVPYLYGYLELYSCMYNPVYVQLVTSVCQCCTTLVS